MADISMCNGEQCPIRKMCYRYTAPQNDLCQSWVEYVYDFKNKECDGFLKR